MPPRLFVSCAEPSGDRLAADVLSHVLQAVPDLEVYGGCGPRLRALGARSVVDMEQLAVMGVGEVLRRLGPLLAARRVLRQALKEGPSLALFVDGPSLHLPLAQEARRHNTPTAGLVCPQIWAWKPDRTATIARAYEQLYCLFDFEPPLLAAAAAVHGSKVHHPGHPVLDRVPPATARVPAPRPTFGFAPGSRDQELQRHVPVFLATAARLLDRAPDTRILWAGPPSPALPDWVTRVDDIAQLQPCHAVLTKSGTVTLELACMGIPIVVAHAVAASTHLFGRLLVRHVDHIALPNVLSRHEVVPERLGRLDSAELAVLLQAAVGAPAVSLPALGPPGATRRIADGIVSQLRQAGPSGDKRLPGAP